MNLHGKKVITATLLESIYIENHPDRRSSGWCVDDLISWGLSMGLISKKEADEAMEDD